MRIRNYCSYPISISRAPLSSPTPPSVPYNGRGGDHSNICINLVNPVYCCSTNAGSCRPACNTASLLPYSHLPSPLYLANSNMAEGYSRRKSFLTLTPVDFSLTDGTNIPAPPDTPPRSPSPIPLARPPTTGGGPLSSHPTSAEDIRSATLLPPTPDPENEAFANMSTSNSSNHDMDRSDSFRTPGSPASANQKPSKAEQQKQGQSVRKLFSLNNLRNSFSSSRTSLQSQNTSSVETSPQPPQADSFKRPTSGHTITPQMRPRSKSGSWFKRKSSMFMFNGNGDLDVVSEDRPATTAESAKRMKEDYSPAPAREVHSPAPAKEAQHPVSVREAQISPPMEVVHSPAPLLPEIGGLGNGNMSGGDLGWNEDMFKR
jgi:hypothetical protein